LIGSANPWIPASRAARAWRARSDRAGQGDDVWPRGDDLAPVGRGLRESESGLERGELCRIAPIDDPRLDLRPSEEGGNVGEGRPGSSADDPEAQTTSNEGAGRRCAIAHIMTQPPLTEVCGS